MNLLAQSPDRPDRHSRSCAGAPPESLGSGTTIDIPGVGFVTGAAIGLVWALMRGNDTGWTSLEVVAALMAGSCWPAPLSPGSCAPASRWCQRGSSMTAPFSSGRELLSLPIASSALFFMAQFLPTALGYGPLGTGLLPWTATLFVVHRSTTGSSSGSASGR
jgi:hypothetical protein